MADRFTINILQQHQRHLEGLTDAVDTMAAVQSTIEKQNDQIVRLLSTTTTDRLMGFLRALSATVQLALIACLTVLLAAILFLGAILWSGESPVAFSLRFIDRSGETVSSVFGTCGKSDPSAPTSNPRITPEEQ
tara:strand:- start:1288 stop:1689 length:402 start_codon:yes stop_codon:yes gene_type:complete